MISGVCPQQIAHESFIRDFRGPSDGQNVHQMAHLRTQPAVHAEYLATHHCSDGHAVETTGENFPKLHGISPLALVIETIYPIQGGALMVSSQEEKVIRIFDFVAQKQGDTLQTLIATIDIVAKE
jgi:hypothetical protein